MRLAAGFAPNGEFDVLWQRDLPAIRATYPGLGLVSPFAGVRPTKPITE